MKRADAVVIQVVVTEYDEAGVPVGEQTTGVTKVFRGKLAAFLAAVDAAVSGGKLDEPATSTLETPAGQAMPGLGGAGRR
jgi:hypothetical protein